VIRILGIDYGEKRIGLALSDPLGYSAQGLETLLNAGKHKSVESIAKICAEHKVSEIVIGLPINMDGSEGPKAREILALVPLLEEKAGVPVKTWDERLSSRQAGRLMIEEGLSRRKQKLSSDRLAATLILQGYLESRRR
jgi:putative Holliday junction resolvase